MNAQSAILVERLKERLNSQKGDPQPVDMCPYITLCALDIICGEFSIVQCADSPVFLSETSMGKQLKSQFDSSSPYIQGIMDFTEVASYRSTHPWTWSDFIFETFSAMGRRFKRSLDEMHNFTKDVSALKRGIFA